MTGIYFKLHTTRFVIFSKPTIKTEMIKYNENN